MNLTKSYDTSDVSDNSQEKKQQSPKSQKFQFQLNASSESDVDFISVADKRCTLCDENFSNLELLQEHYTRTHCENLSFINFEKNRCTLCKADFMKIEDLKNHISDKHQLDPVTGRDLNKRSPVISKQLDKEPSQKKLDRKEHSDANGRRSESRFFKTLDRKFVKCLICSMKTSSDNKHRHLRTKHKINVQGLDSNNC